MGYTFVTSADVDPMTEALVNSGVPVDNKLPALVNKSLDNLETLRFNKKPETYKKIYAAASEADPVTKFFMGVYGSNLVKTFTAGAQTMAPNSWYGQASKAIEDVMASGKAVPDTAVGKFFGRSLLPLMADSPIFSALGSLGLGSIGTLMMYNAEGQAADIVAGRKKEFDFKSLAKAGLFGAVFHGTGKLIGRIPYLNQLGKTNPLMKKGARVTKFWEKVKEKYPDFSKISPEVNKKLKRQLLRMKKLDTQEYARMSQLTPSGGVAERVGKRLLSSGVSALPASFVSPAVELFDPTTNQKWDIKDFANTWALFASMDVMGLIKAGEWGAMESRLKQQGVDPKQATVLTNLAQTNPTASIHQVFGSLMHNKASVKNAANVWKMWQVEQGLRGEFGLVSKMPKDIRNILRTAEEEQVRLTDTYGAAVPSPANRLATALEIYAKSKKGLHPKGKAKMINQAKLLRGFEGNLYGIDKEGLREALGMATQKKSAESARIKLFTKLKAMTPERLKVEAKKRKVTSKNKTSNQLTKDILMTVKGTPSRKSKIVDMLSRQIRRIEKNPVSVKPLPEGTQIKPMTWFERFSDPVRFFTALGAKDVVEPGTIAAENLMLERSHIKAWTATARAELIKLTHTSQTEMRLARLRNKPTKAERALAVFLHNRKPDYKKVPENLRKLYKDMRFLSDTMRERANVVYKFLDMRDKNGKLIQIEYLPGYLTRLITAQAKAAKGEHLFSPEMEYHIRRMSPKDVSNFTRLHRTLETPEFEGLLMDPFKCMDAMTSVDLKTIYLHIPSVLFKEQMDNLMKRGAIPESTRNALENWMNITIKGFPSPSDKMTDATLAQLKVPQFMNATLKPFGRTWGDRSIKNTSDGLGRMVHDSTIMGRVKLPIRNLTQKLLGLGLYDSYSFLKASGIAPKECMKIIMNSHFYNLSRKAFLEALPASEVAKIEKAGFYMYGKSHVSNVNHTMKTAWFAAERWSKSVNPNISKFWRNKENVKKEMDWGADSCHYSYFKTRVPTLYRSKTASLFFKLQSWPMNYAFKYHRELFHRLITGRPGWAGSGPSVLPTSARLGMLRHIVSSVIFIEGLKKGLGLDYSRIAGLGVIPSQLSPVGQLLTGMGQWANGDDWERENAERTMVNALKAFIPGHGAVKDVVKALNGEGDISSLLFYKTP